MYRFIIIILTPIVIKYAVKILKYENIKKVTECRIMS